MNTVIVEQNVPVRMRDGVILYADIYRPSSPGKYPVLLTRLPYGKQAIVFQNSWALVQAGYVVIIQDCRGTFTSEGQFNYCFHEGDDGYDTVEWAAALPYSTGAVGMTGVSYLGWTQWSAALRRPPHLRAIAPTQTWSDYSGMRFRGGAFELGDTLQWHLQMSMGKLTREMTAAGKPAQEIAAVMNSIIDYMDTFTGDGYKELPLRRLEPLVKAGLADIIGVLLDPGPGGQQPGMKVDYSEVDVPALNIAGWYDVFQQYTLDNYIGARKDGRGKAKQSQLLVGPWTHGVMAAAPGMMVGEMNFGARASGALLVPDVQIRWFDHWLKGIDNGIDSAAPAFVFMTGDNRWVTMSDWPPPQAKDTPLYLGTNNSLDFTKPGINDGSSAYTYDPLNPVPTVGGNIMLALPGVRDQRPLSIRPDVLTFTGRSLGKPLTVAGHVNADLWISTSAPDTDFVVRLIDQHPDGYMHNLCDGILRARYRDSLQQSSWLKPGHIYNLKVDLWSVAHVFKPGHRLVIQVTSSSFPRWDRNWNTTEDPGSATGGQPAHQIIWHDNEHPSCILLPVLNG